MVERIGVRGKEREKWTHLFGHVNPYTLNSVVPYS